MHSLRPLAPAFSLTVAIAVAGVFAVAGCSSPQPGTPLEVAAVAGHWFADDVRLDIAPDGTVNYEKTGAAHTTVTGLPLQNLTTTGFDVGVFGLTTHFVINAPPATTGDVTRMTVDGTVLEKRSAAALAAAAAAATSAAWVAGETPLPSVPVPAPAALPPAGTLASLVGHWEGEGMRLHITADSKVHYQRGGKSIDGANVSDITATSFEAGVFGITTTFKLDEPPHVVDGKVLMTVDGLALVQVQP